MRSGTSFSLTTLVSFTKECLQDGMTKYLLNLSSSTPTILTLFKPHFLTGLGLQGRRLLQACPVS